MTQTIAQFRSPNPQAQKIHDELFPGHISTLAGTDPELIEVFDNFAFDETLRDSQLETKVRLLVQLAAIIASQAVNEYRAILGGALNVGVTAVEAKESLVPSCAVRRHRQGLRLPSRHK